MVYNLKKAAEEVMDELKGFRGCDLLVDADIKTLNKARSEAYRFLECFERVTDNKAIVKAVYNFASPMCRQNKKKNKGELFIPQEEYHPGKASRLLNFEVEKIMDRYSGSHKCRDGIHTYWYPDNAQDVIDALVTINDAILVPDPDYIYPDDEEEENEKERFEMGFYD